MVTARKAAEVTEFGAVNRRSFIVGAGAVLASASVFGCADQLGSDESTGDIELRVSGLASAGGGSVTVRTPGNPNAEAIVTLPAPDTNGVSLSVATGIPTGDYSVEYQAPASHIPVDPASATRQVTVLANQLVTADFLVQAVGALEVRVTGLSLSALVGGTVTVAPVDDPTTETTVALSVPEDGVCSGTLESHPAGESFVRLLPPSGYISAGQSLTQTVAVPVGGTAQIEFAIQESGAPTPLIFASDWSTAIGDSNSAVTDGGKWSRNNGGALSRQVIVSSTALDFPTANVMRNEFVGNAYAVNVLLLGQGGELTEGQTLYRRVYWRYNIPSGPNPGSSNHPLESTDSVTLNVVRPLAWELDNSVSGAPFNARWLMSYDNVGGDLSRTHRWRVTLLPNTTYRIEWAMTRMASDASGNVSWRLQSRIYTSDDALLYDDSGFICTNFQHDNHSLASTGAAANSWTTAGQRTRAISGTAIGYQGGYNYPGEYLYWGGFAASLSDWCGPFTSGESA